MRKIDKIIIHYTETPEGRAVSVDEIEQWHKQRGFRKIGYHYVVALDGKLQKGREVWEIGAHCAGQNLNSIGVAYVGGVDRNGKKGDTRTKAQKATLTNLINALKVQFPAATIHGHCEFSKKVCPGFNVNELK